MFKQLRQFSIRMIAGANIATIIILFLIGFSDHLHPERFAMLSNVGLLFPVFLFINLGFLIFWLIFKVRYALIPFMGFIICYVPVREYIPFNIPHEAPKGSIKILSYNTWAFAEGEMGEDGINPVVKYIKEQNADIVCLQEAGHNGDVENQLDSLLYPMYAYRDTTWHSGGGDVVGI